MGRSRDRTWCEYLPLSVDNIVNVPYAESFTCLQWSGLVSNSSVVAEGEEAEHEDFQVPRGLICAYSAYFDAVFRKLFAESSTGQSVIDDVQP